VEDNIPRPDPSDRTIEAIRNAILGLRELLGMQMCGIESSIGQHFKNIEKQLADSATRIALDNATSREAVAVALAGVLEAANERTIKFEALERRVAALELAISQAGGRSLGTSLFGSTVVQASVVISVVVGIIALILTWQNSSRLATADIPGSMYLKQHNSP
jgi:hypothetical protein